MDVDINALRMIERERDVPLRVMLPAIEKAVLTAYFKMRESVHDARAEVDLEAGRVIIWVPEYDEDGELLREVDDTPSGFDRIAASTARQVVLSHLRDAEDEKIVGGFQSRVGELVVGTIMQGPSRYVVHVHLSDVEGVLPPSEQVPGEDYSHGRRIRAYVVDAKKGPNGPVVTLSRSHPKLVERLFEREVPEIPAGAVEIMALAREAGHRTKMAVVANEPGINPKGACIGEMGNRVKAVMAELGTEKIDIVDYSDDPTDFIAYALSPATVLAVEILDRFTRSARAIVPDYQLSLAIGKEGQNARLAAKLTGWRIDIVSDMETIMG